MNVEANWWQFSIEPDERGKKIVDDGSGLREINPATTDGRRLIDYGDYLGLEKLLAAQIPASKNPDERIFIATHHLFEITFKQMIFDLTVISKTFETLTQILLDAKFHLICTSVIEGEEFWRPARLAANRIEYSAKTVLPVFFHFLDKSENKNETFSGAEYFKFRPFLPPASGFQSSQFRLIQRAFGKSELFKIRLFPSQEYSKDYTGKDSADLVEITNQVVLRDETKIANPDQDSPLKQAADIEVYINEVLTRLAQFAEPKLDVFPPQNVAESRVETAVDAFSRILAIHRKDQEKIGEKPENADEFDRQAVSNFEKDLKRVVNAENARRNNLQSARAGSLYVQNVAPESDLTCVLNQLVAADKALFGADENSFLSLHLKMAADRIREVQEAARGAGAPEQPAGTGGGGVPYLINVRNNLVPMFPFLIAFQ